jgi:hypothetical protein
MRNFFFRHKGVVFLLALLLVAGMLYACGGGGGGGTVPTGGSKVTLSGTAAAGAPIAGKVVAVGANNVQITAYINYYGQFSLDASTLTFPAMIYAEGSVGDKSVTLHSVAFSAGTINVTPITDFIVRNALQGVDPTSATTITQAAVDAAKAQVMDQLDTMLTDLGLSAASIDLLTTPFDADHTGIDQLLDLVTIEVSATGDTVTVTNNLSGETFQENLVNPTQDSAGLVDQITTELSDGAAIRLAWKALQVIYNTASPNPLDAAAWINQYVAAEFLDEGENKEQMLYSWSVGGEGPSPFMVLDGFINRPYDIAGIANTYYDKGYWVDLAIFMGGVQIELFETVFIGNTTDGTWRWYGDQSWIGTGDDMVQALYNVPSPYGYNASTTHTYHTGLHFWFRDDYGYAIANGVQSIVINGPGLPANGLVLNTTSYNPDTFAAPWATSPTGIYEMNDFDIAIMPATDIVYDIYLCSETAASLDAQWDEWSPTSDGAKDTPGPCAGMLQHYTQTIPRRPLLSTELTLLNFPLITSPTSLDINTVLNPNLGIGNSQSITVDWVLPEGLMHGGTYIWFCDQTNTNCENFEVWDIAPTATQATIDLSTSSVSYSYQGHLTVSAYDVFDREFKVQHVLGHPVTFIAPTETLITGTVGVPYSDSTVPIYVDLNTGTQPYTFLATGLPASLTMSTGGNISGTPTAGDEGTYSVTATVTDALGDTDTATFSLTIDP